MPVDAGLFGDEPNHAYLNLVSGELVWPEDHDESEDYHFSDEHLRLPDLMEDFAGSGYARMESFVISLEPGPVKQQLSKAIEGRGAFRRFKDIVYGSGNIELKLAWQWFETRELREEIVAWLEREGIEPEWDRDIFEPPSLPNKRPELLQAVLQFVLDVKEVQGVRRIALLGSLSTDKAQPKDVDLLVDVALDELARRSRQLRGKTTQTGHARGADVFLSNPQGDYIGRLCSWRICAPGKRMACEAQHCGRRQFLYDDLQYVQLERDLVANPPMDLWPKIITRVTPPDDVVRELLTPLRTE